MEPDLRSFARFDSPDNVRFFYDNLLDYAGVVLTPTSEVDTLPAENLKNELRKRVWRTGTSTGTERLVIDLGSAQAVTAFILLDHTLLNVDSGLLLEAHTSDSWGAPSFSQALTWADGTLAATFASQTYRYWRLSFTKSVSSQSRDIGRIFLGTYAETEHAPDFAGHDETLEDPSRKAKTLGGQTWTDLQEKFHVIVNEMTHVSQTLADQIRTIAEAVGQSISFFVQVDTSSPLNTVYYVKFRRAFGRSVVAVDSGLVWDLAKLEFEEQL